MLQIRKIARALMVLVSLGAASVEASHPYVDYWETLQEEKGYLTISSVWTESHPPFSIIRFQITEDQGDHAPIPLTVIQKDMKAIEENPWRSGDLLVFKFLIEEDYSVTNLRTQEIVMVVEPTGSQHYIKQKE